MDELRRRMGMAKSQLTLDWDEQELDAITKRHHRKRSKRKALRMAYPALLAASLLGLAGYRMRAAKPEPAPTALLPADRAPIATSSASTTELADGTRISKLSEESSFEVREQSASRQLVEVTRGGARFAVSHIASRVFRVVAGGVRVDVLGTEFTVERQADGPIGGPGAVRVAVLSGEVQVSWGQQTALLVQGQERLFPAGDAAPAIPESSEGLGTGTDPQSPESHLLPHEGDSPRMLRGWRKLAVAHQFQDAYRELHRAKERVDGAADLLLMADVARLTHHPVEAVQPLQLFLRRYSRDERAPVAAFTLGRVLMDVKRPGEAASVFAQAARRASLGTVKEDALAREVEAWALAGNKVRAQQSGSEYTRLYPAGVHVSAVRRAAFGE